MEVEPPSVMLWNLKAWKQLSKAWDMIVKTVLSGPTKAALETHRYALSCLNQWFISDEKQQASGLVSMVKICKSIQHGKIPAMARSGKPSSLIDPDLPLQFAYQSTKVRQDALIGISAAGWGGVNSHIVLKVPPSEYLRKPTVKFPSFVFKEETLAAPRLNSVRAANSSAKHRTEVDMVMEQVALILPGARSIGPDTDLRAAGLDSISFVRLSRNIKTLSNFLLP